MASFIDILAPSRVDGGGRDGPGADRRLPPRLEACVRFDLQQLLNARRPPDAFTAEFPELPTSVLNYGLCDFAFAEIVSDDDRDQLAQHIADVIAVFEPRLADVRVAPREAAVGESASQTVIHFQISARLVGPAGAADAEFDNTFEWTTGHHEVKPS